MSELSLQLHSVQHPSTKQPASNTNNLGQPFTHPAKDTSQSPKEETCSDVSWSSTDNDDHPLPPSPSSKPQKQDEIGNYVGVKTTSHIITDEQQQPKSMYKCKICLADLTSLHYTKRVVHVKQCMAGKRNPPQQSRQPSAVRTIKVSSDFISNKHIKQQHMQEQQQQQPTIPSTAPQQQVPCTTADDVDCIKSWLQQLGLEYYHSICIREEIDLSVTHMITAEEWQEVGVLNRIHQRRLVEAGRKKGGILVGERQDKNMMRVHQDQYTALVRGTTTTRDAHAYHDDDDENGENNININITTTRNENTSCSIQPTPPMILGHSKAVTAARVTPNSTLWASAATCQQIAPTLEARLVSLKRKRNVDGNDDDREEELARGVAPLGPHIVGHTTAAVVTVESRASKLQKLEALREEVRSHEEILKDLKGMVHTLESDLGIDIQ